MHACVYVRTVHIINACHRSLSRVFNYVDTDMVIRNYVGMDEKKKKRGKKCACVYYRRYSILSTESRHRRQQKDDDLFCR